MGEQQMDSEEEEEKEEEIVGKRRKHASNKSLSRFKIPSLFRNGSASQIKHDKLMENERERRSQSMIDLDNDVRIAMEEEEQGDIVSLLSVLVQHGFYSKKNLNSVQQLTCLAKFNNYFFLLYFYITFVCVIVIFM